MNEDYFIIYFDDDSEIRVNIDKDFLKKYAISWYANPTDEVREFIWRYFYDKFLNYFDGYTFKSIEKALVEKPLSYRWNINKIDWFYEDTEGSIDSDILDSDWQYDYLGELDVSREVKDVDESEMEDYPSKEIKKFPR